MDSRLRRLSLITLALVCASHAVPASAQPRPVLGYVANDNADAERLAAFKKGLRDLGCVEGAMRVEASRIEFKS
jgi:hypothetical protein